MQSAATTPPISLEVLRGAVLAIASVMHVDKPSSHLMNTELTQKILKVFFAVYNELGTGFPEFVYRRALVVGMKSGGMVVQEDVALPVWFRGEHLATFRADLLVDSLVLAEVKASPAIEDLHKTHVLNYLKASDIEIGLLLNFGKSAEFKRLMFDNVAKRRQRTLEDAQTSVVEILGMPSS